MRLMKAPITPFSFLSKIYFILRANVSLFSIIFLFALSFESKFSSLYFSSFKLLVSLFFSISNSFNFISVSLILSFNLSFSSRLVSFTFSAFASSS